MYQTLPFQSSRSDFSHFELSQQNNTNTASEIRHDDAIVGVLIADNTVAEKARAYRFQALDPRFQLLDGSWFFGVQKAAAAVDRISHLLTSPVAANEP